VMNDAELEEAARLGKQKKVYDDSIRDPDDVYFEVQRREEERREKGLPPLIGVLPRQCEGPLSTVEEEQGEEADGDEGANSAGSEDVRLHDRIRSTRRSMSGTKSGNNRRIRRQPVKT
jgi:hypothetical protein